MENKAEQSGLSPTVPSLLSEQAQNDDEPKLVIVEAPVEQTNSDGAALAAAHQPPLVSKETPKPSPRKPKKRKPKVPRDETAPKQPLTGTHIFPSLYWWQFFCKAQADCLSLAA